LHLIFVIKLVPAPADRLAGEAGDVHELCVGLQGVSGVGSYAGAERSRCPAFLGCHRARRRAGITTAFLC